MVVYVLPERGNGRLGLSVSRKVGEAVVRNRTRRRLSEAFAARAGENLAGTDVVIIARGPAAKADYQILESELAALLDEAAELIIKETGS